MNCTLCGKNTPHPLCANCARGWIADLNELWTLMTRLEGVARREEHIGGRQQGHATSPFAATPVDLSAMDLLTQAQETLEDIAANNGIWDGTWRRLVKRLIAMRQWLGNDRHATQDRERTARLVNRIRLCLTPPSERIIIGKCLNPACKAELYITGRETTVVCPSCDSEWTVEAVRQRRRESLKDETFTGTPAEASRYLYRRFNLVASRKAVTMWLQRGSLPDTESLGDGRHVFHLTDLVAHAEQMRPRPGHW